MGKKYNNGGMMLFEFFGLFTLLDTIADSVIPEFEIPQFPSLSKLKKHAYSAFGIMIKIQITNHIYQFVSDTIKANGTEKELIAFQFVHEVLSLIPAFWVAIDLYRHSIKPKIPCFFAKVFAHIYATAMVICLFYCFIDSEKTQYI